MDYDNTEWIKIPETKGATTFSISNLTNSAYICVAIKKTLQIYEITRKKNRYSFWREIQMPLNIQTLCVIDYLVAVGTISNFIVYHITNREEPPLCKHFFVNSSFA